MTEAAKRYEKLLIHRNPYTRRAEACAELTLPYLFPREGIKGDDDLPTPYQSIGARGVNNLAAKMLLAMFPINEQIFRYMMDEAAEEELTGDPAAKGQVDTAFARIERIVTQYMEGRSLRPALYEALRHVILVGNVLLYVTPDGTLRVFNLRQYVTYRAPDGSPLEHIIKESVHPDQLPTKMVAAILEEDTENKLDADGEWAMYTHVKFRGGKWHVYQEVCGKEVPGSKGTYRKDRCPWISLRFNRASGEHYGRSYVEEYIGDLISCDGLSQSILEGAAASARLIFLVNPNSSTDLDEVSSAENGTFVTGKRDDVGALQAEKAADLRVAATEKVDIIERLSFAFLLNSAVQRAGERVTAEEIRFVAGELEQALGGIYSTLAQELQLPLINVYIGQLTRKGRLPNIPAEAATPTVVTGIEALGRGNDLNKLMQLAQVVQSVPEGGTFVNYGEFLTRVTAAMSINTAGLIKSAAQVEQEKAQQMAMAMAQSAAGPVAGNLSKAATQPTPPQPEA